MTNIISNLIYKVKLANLKATINYKSEVYSISQKLDSILDYIKPNDLEVATYEKFTSIISWVERTKINYVNYKKLKFLIYTVGNNCIKVKLNIGDKLITILSIEDKNFTLKAGYRNMDKFKLRLPADVTKHYFIDLIYSLTCRT